jgi:hypothetical protein
VVEELRLVRPQPRRQLLAAADDALLVDVGTVVDDAQDLQHGVGEVGVPAAGAEADLAEDLAVLERGERGRRGEEAVERHVVQARDQAVPDGLDGLDVAAPDGVLHRGQLRGLLQRLVPRVGHLLVDHRQLGHRVGEVAHALEVDDRAGGVGGQRVRERRGLQADLVDVVEQGGCREREAHGAHLRDRLRVLPERDRPHPAAELLGLVQHRSQPELHQLVGRDQARDAAADHGDLGAVRRRGHRAEARRVAQPLVVGEREVRAEHRDRGTQAVQVVVVDRAGVVHVRYPRLTVVTRSPAGAAEGGQRKSSGRRSAK